MLALFFLKETGRRTAYYIDKAGIKQMSDPKGSQKVKRKEETLGWPKGRKIQNSYSPKKVALGTSL